MNDLAAPQVAVAPPGKTVQQYIDETPAWSDGTTLPTAPLTPMQWRIWWLATAGKFFEGLVVFMTRVAMPLIAAEFGLNATEHGLVAAAPLFGILVGATALGSLADHFGRKRVFIVEMAIFSVFLASLAISPSFDWLVVSLFAVGLALGGDYPTAHLVISESMPSRLRGRLVLGAFGFQAIGALFGTLIGFVVLYANPSLEDWRWMYATAIVPAVLVTIGRLSVTESAHWLISRGLARRAEAETQRLLKRDPPYPKTVKLADVLEFQGYHDGIGAGIGFGDLFKTRKTRRATILASVPWFLQDLGTYGIGIFTPTILATAFGYTAAHSQGVADLVRDMLIATKGAVLIDVLLIAGIVAAMLLADRVGRIRLQLFGFIGCALALFLAALALDFDGATGLVLIFAGFMVFNFMTNLGPNAQTYLLAGEVFPTRVRGKGAGFAASFAKLGAVATAFLFPILLHGIGTPALLAILAGTSLLGAALTWAFRIETTGINLETVGHETR